MKVPFYVDHCFHDKTAPLPLRSLQDWSLLNACDSSHTHEAAARSPHHLHYLHENERPVHGLYTHCFEEVRRRDDAHVLPGRHVGVPRTNANGLRVRDCLVHHVDDPGDDGLPRRSAAGDEGYSSQVGAEALHSHSSH